MARNLPTFKDVKSLGSEALISGGNIEMRAILSAGIEAIVLGRVPAMAVVQTVITGGVSFATMPFTYDFVGGNRLTISDCGRLFLARSDFDGR